MVAEVFVAIRQQASIAPESDAARIAMRASNAALGPAVRVLGQVCCQCYALLAGYKEKYEWRRDGQYIRQSAPQQRSCRACEQETP